MQREVKDSGKRMEFASGMVRDLTDGKIKWHLIRSGPMHQRWATHLTLGAVKYGDDNWLKANGPEELKRFKESADRHFNQWIAGETDEDHAAAVFFNINGAEYVTERMATIKSTGCQSAKDGMVCHLPLDNHKQHRGYHPITFDEWVWYDNPNDF